MKMFLVIVPIFKIRKITIEKVDVVFGNQSTNGRWYGNIMGYSISSEDFGKVEEVSFKAFWDERNIRRS